MPVLQAMNNWTVVKSAFRINTTVSRIKTLMKNCMVHKFSKCLFSYTVHSQICFNLISDGFITLKIFYNKWRNIPRKPENKWISCIFSFCSYL